VKPWNLGYDILIFTIIFFLAAELISCSGTQDNTRMNERVDSLERKLTDSYKPGLGEFMIGIQIHHAKLWYAGQNRNWELAGFETDEIKEIIADIHTYQSQRKESKMTVMLSPALDSMNLAIQQKNLTGFIRSYNLLTNTCNNCHRASGFGFNVVKTPESPPFSNQDFKLKSR
jgi:hypothetical protein